MSTVGMQPYSLTKWYLDCVDEDGRTAIAYWSEVAWHGLAINWHSLSVYRPGTEPVERSSAKEVRPPTNADGTIAWHTPELGCDLRSHSRVPVIAERLLDRDEAVVDWRCESAHGDVIVECDGLEPVRGKGYAECLNMTLPPWQLPIDTLRWGRWIAAEHDRSVVWIDWQGRQRLTRVFADGQNAHGGVVDDQRVESGNTILTIHDRQTLYSRSLADTLGALRPVIAPLLPQGWLAVEDCKWRSRGTLRSPGRPDQSGWVIHETVRWPS